MARIPVDERVTAVLDSASVDSGDKKRKRLGMSCFPVCRFAYSRVPGTTTVSDTVSDLCRYEDLQGER